MTQTAKHTPGPWECDPNGNIRRQGGGVFFGTMRFPMNDEESIANGRLIAAAPTIADVLEAIRKARDYHAEHGVYPPGTLHADQQFDDWAADVAEAALRLAGRIA